MAVAEGTWIEPILSALASYHPDADTDLVHRAYEFAEKSHEGQLRLSGDPYISHPAQVALILTQLNADTESVAASLLHDVVEDTGVTLTELEDLFGGTIADLVGGVSKLSKINFSSRQEAQASGFRRMLFAMARDIRVVVIKLADRLHNMRTLSVFPEDKRRETARETLQIFAPLAERLGIWRIKWELEDLCLRELDPTAYRAIEERIARTRQERLQEVEEAVSSLKPRFEAAALDAEIYGRAKHFHSIYLKMHRQGLDFEDIYDLTALRVLVSTIPECYAALGIIHAAWPPIPGMFTDFISRPKSNRYRSLHTKVIGPRGEPLEVQIRTWEMHHVCEYGVASHWQYKDPNSSFSEFERRISWLRQLLDLGSDVQDANEYLQMLKEDLLLREAFVFTPRGDLVELPAGSTPVDFAYRIHTDVGNQCVGAKVNGKMVPLSTSLESGDIVEIATQHNSRPSLDWLHFVTTASARSKIRAYFRKQTFEENRDKGRELLEEEARQRFGAEWETLMTETRLEGVAKDFSYPGIERLYAAVGFREVSAEAVVGRVDTAVLREQLGRLESIGLLAHPLPEKRGPARVVAAGMDNLSVRLSKCCDPLPGDPIIGYVTRGRGLAVHRVSCHNAQALMQKDSHRILPCAWEAAGDGLSYQARMELDAIDRVGLLKDITAIVADVGVNISEAKVKTGDGGRRAMMDIVFDVAGAEQIDELVQRLAQLSDILRVRRIPK